MIQRQYGEGRRSDQDQPHSAAGCHLLRGLGWLSAVSINSIRITLERGGLPVRSPAYLLSFMLRHAVGLSVQLRRILAPLPASGLLFPPPCARSNPSFLLSP